jgi:putative salt-induced outer membrane protein YdiY
MKRMILSVTWAVMAAGTWAFAEDTPKKPWSDVAEFGLTMTSGNAEGTNYAFGNKFKYTWSNAELTFDAIALRAESTTRVASDVGGSVVITETTATTASSYGLALVYRRNISERLFWYAGATWYQNFFAGIDDRYILGGGIGYTFVKTDRHLFKGELGLDLTRQDPLGDPDPADPTTDVFETTDYIAIRATLNYEFKINEKSKLTEDLNFIENLDTTSAWRANSITALTVGFTDNLALKLSYTVMYSNEPAFKSVPASTLVYQAEKTDTILVAALVVNF